MTLIKNSIYLIILLALAAGGVSAQESSEQDELDEFLNLLEQQTSLATTTRLNADFVPGMLSVLNYEQMQRRGFRILWDALGSLPGVQTTMSSTGMRSVTVRGVGGIFEPSKVKLLLNGKSVNSSASATTGTLYDTPVEQIERVEFIRGPGSAIYGEFAYAGVLNVITRKQGQQVSVGIDSSEGGSFSALYSFAKPASDFKGSFNFAANQTQGEDIDSGLDRTPAGLPSYSPGDINNKRDFVSAIVDLQFGSLNALIQVQQGNRGDHFGANNLLPPDKKETIISDTVISAGLSQVIEIDERLTAGWSLDLLQNETEQNSLFLGQAEIFGGLGNEGDVVADSLLREERIEAKANLQYAANKHKLFGELVFADVEVTESEQSINLDPVTNLPSPGMHDYPGPVDDSADRSSISLVLQDEYSLNDEITLTAGLRYDDYEDIDSEVSPRLALVWRRSSKHSFKTQWARAFRPPSLIETGGALVDNIEAETNDTFELGHVYHGANLVLRNTLYYSELDDLIVFQDFAPFGYSNTGSFDLYGYEFELEKSVNSDWDIVASLSLQEYDDDEQPGAIPWMIKLGTEYRVLPLTAVHLQINSTDSRNREDFDSRSDFEQTNQVDATVRTQNFLDVSGLNFRWGIKNLLDETLKHPASADTYADDYPYSDGATLWAQFIYQPND